MQETSILPTQSDRPKENAEATKERAVGARVGTSVIYAIRSGGFIKIGKADDLAHRLDELQCGNPVRLTVAHEREVPVGLARHIEHAAHRALAQHRHGGEWFRIAPGRAVAAIDAAVADILAAVETEFGRRLYASRRPAYLDGSHGNAKVTAEQVKAIRLDPRSASIVAQEYGVSRGCVKGIRNGRSWKHVV